MGEFNDNDNFNDNGNFNGNFKNNFKNNRHINCHVSGESCLFWLLNSPIYCSRKIGLKMD